MDYEYTFYLEKDDKHIRIVGDKQFLTVFTSPKSNQTIITFGKNKNVVMALAKDAVMSTEDKFMDFYKKALKAIRKQDKKAWDNR